jgi:hypothetical protein
MNSVVEATFHNNSCIIRLLYIYNFINIYNTEVKNGGAIPLLPNIS